MFIVPNTNFDSRSKKVGAQEKYVNGRTVIKESLLLYGNFQKSANMTVMGLEFQKVWQ